MREISLVQKIKSRRRLRSYAADIVGSMSPVWVLRRLMERTFINFGVETTNICNADCTFCGYRFMRRPKKVMSWQVYKKATRDFAMCGGGTVNFTPTVGDPLVDKRLIKKIRFARSFATINHVFLYTNGILLNRFDLDELLHSGLTRLAISTFIGSPEGYKRYFGVDKYNQVISNIIAVAKRNRELGSPVNITLHLRVEGEKRRWYETDAYRSITPLISGENISYLDIYDSWGGLIRQDDLPGGTEIDKPLSVEQKKRSPCFELYRRVHILADGNVGACVCVDLESEIKIGNINTQSLKDIWHGPRLKGYRREWVKGNLPNVCRNCTRYQGIDEFIATNRKRVVVDFARRVFPRLFHRLSH